jgi:hypothetical protein
MRLAILADNRASFVKPTAEGLHRMLARLGVESTLFYDGIDRVRPIPFNRRQPTIGTLARHAAAYLGKQRSFVALMRELARYDAIIVVLNLPSSFMTGFFRDRAIRRLLPRTPIINYDLHYLLTCPEWVPWLRHGPAPRNSPTVAPAPPPSGSAPPPTVPCSLSTVPSSGGGIQMPGTGGHRLLDRYDWYLLASASAPQALPPEPPRQPISLIGLDLDDGTLRPDPKPEFVALVDFVREGQGVDAERAVQLEALRRTNTKYITLEGRYSIEDIRAIYRRCALYFVAWLESFGLPICELQACGAYVATPYPEWVRGHWIKPDLHQPGPGTLSPNFIVYRNDVDLLCREIERVKAEYDPKHVFDTFLEFQPQLFRGDTAELQRFLTALAEGRINSRSHYDYRGLADRAEPFKAPGSS